MLKYIRLLFCFVIFAFVLISSKSLFAEENNYLYHANPDSVLVQIEKKHKTLKEQLTAIEEYIEIVYHTNTGWLGLNYKSFFEKYRKKVIQLNDNYHKSLFYLNIGTKYAETIYSDSSLFYFLKAKELSAEEKFYALMIHSTIFIGVQNGNQYYQKINPTNFRNKYYWEAYQYSFKADDEFAKAAANWSLAEIYKNENSDSANYYVEIALRHLDNLADNKLHLKYFGTLHSLSYINNSKELSEYAGQKLILTIEKLREKKITEIINFDYLSSITYDFIGNPDSSAFYAYKYLESKENGIDSVFKNRYEREIVEILYKYEKSKGNFEKALKFNEIFLKLVQSRNLQDHRVTTLEIEKELEKERFIYEQTLMSERQLYLLILISVIIISFISISYFIYKRYRYRQKVNDALHALNESKDNLFAIISHDLRSPASLFKQMLDMLVFNFDKMDSEEKSKHLRKLRDSGNRMLLLLDNLLNWSKLNLEKIDCKYSPVNINEIIHFELEYFRELADKKQINTELNLVQTGKIYADENVLQIVIRNLISNAIKFTNTNCKLIIATEITDNKFHLIVKNEGPSIPYEVINNLRNKQLIRSSAGTSKEKGSGLGLSIIRDLSEVHNAELIFNNSETGFTEIAFVFALKQN